MACGLFSLSNGRRGTLRDRKPVSFQDLSLLGEVGGTSFRPLQAPRATAHARLRAFSTLGTWAGYRPAS